MMFWRYLRWSPLVAAGALAACDSRSDPWSEKALLAAPKYLSGNQLLISCRYADSSAVRLERDLIADAAKRTCNQYIAGVTDLAIAVDHDHLCLERVEASQLRSVVIDYLGQHPERLHASAASLTYLALRESFPCK
jgi:hypothetical protein